MSSLSPLNTSALQNTVNTSQQQINDILKTLQTGLAINAAGEDPANLYISDRLNTQALDAASTSSNAQDGLSYLQVAQKAYSDIVTELTNIKNIANAALGGTYNDSQLEDFQDLITKSINKIKYIEEGTTFNGVQVFNNSNSAGLVNEHMFAITSKSTAIVTTVTVLPGVGDYDYKSYLANTVNRYTEQAGGILSNGIDPDLTIGANVITIKDASELVAALDNQSSAGKTYVLTDNIDLSGLGVQSNALLRGSFSGTLLGNGYAIKGLEASSSNDYVGLFESVDGGTVKDLILKDFNIQSDRGDVGALAGGLYLGATIDNIAVLDATINAGWSGGGLIGVINDGSVTNSYATGTVTGDASSDKLGGLVGHLFAGSISQSFSTATVTGGTYLGGLVGTLEIGTTVSKSYATGDVTGTSQIGGLLGASLSGSVINSYSLGQVKGLTEVGGLIGINDGTVSNSYSLSKVVDTHTSYAQSELDDVASGEFKNNMPQDAGYNVIYTIAAGENAGVYAFASEADKNNFIAYSDGNNITNPMADVNKFYKLTDAVNDVWSTQELIYSGDKYELSAPIDALDTLGVPDSTVSAGVSYTVYSGEHKGVYAFESVSDAAAFDTYVQGTTFVKSEAINQLSEADAVAAGYDEAHIIRNASEFVSKLAGGTWSDKYIITQDIDLSSLGTLTNAVITSTFFGELDGNGHVLSNLSINTGTDAVSNVGLFSQVLGSISNLGLENVNINSAKGNNVGGLAGIANNVTNCYVTGAVNGDVSVGGLAGLVSNATDCFADVDVSGYMQIGGFAGKNNQVITGCFALGDVSSGGNTSSISIGGFVGLNNSTMAFISDSYSKGTVTVGDNATSIGGFVGENSFTDANSIKGCYSNSELTAGAYATSVGGFVGYNNSATVSQSYSTGSVTTGDFSEKIGGFAGESLATGPNSSISQCYSTGDVVANGSYGNASSNSGGFIGDNGLNSTITDSYSTGEVSCFASTGGFVSANAGTIQRSYTNGEYVWAYSGNAQGFAFSNTGTLDNTNFYLNNQITTAGSALNGDVVANITSATSSWASAVWDKSQALPTLLDMPMEDEKKAVSEYYKLAGSNRWQTQSLNVSANVYSKTDGAFISGLPTESYNITAMKDGSLYAFSNNTDRDNFLNQTDEVGLMYKFVNDASDSLVTEPVTQVGAAGTYTVLTSDLGLNSTDAAMYNKLHGLITANGLNASEAEIIRYRAAIPQADGTYNYSEIVSLGIKSTSGLMKLDNTTTGISSTAGYDGHYVLMNDIDLTGQTWTSLSMLAGGLFDGNQHTISNLNIDKTGQGNVEGLSLFTRNFGMIMNLDMNNVTIKADQANAAPGVNGYIGAVAGYSEGQIVNCNVTGLDINIAGSAASVGGIVGRSVKTTAFIDKCSVEGVIRIGGQGDRIGGFAGWTNEAATPITSSFSNVDVLISSSYSAVSSFIGQAEDTVVKNSFSQGIVETNGVYNSLDSRSLFGSGYGTNVENAYKLDTNSNIYYVSNGGASDYNSTAVNPDNFKASFNDTTGTMTINGSPKPIWLFQGDTGYTDPGNGSPILNIDALNVITVHAGDWEAFSYDNKGPIYDFNNTATTVNGMPDDSAFNVIVQQGGIYYAAQNASDASTILNYYNGTANTTVDKYYIYNSTNSTWEKYSIDKTNNVGGLIGENSSGAGMVHDTFYGPGVVSENTIVGNPADDNYTLGNTEVAGAESIMTDWSSAVWDFSGLHPVLKNVVAEGSKNIAESSLPRLAGDSINTYSYSSYDTYSTTYTKLNTALTNYSELAGATATESAAIAAGYTTIHNATELKNLVNANLNGKYMLMGDIDLSSLGTLTTSLINGTFNGTFDGNGYKVSNLTIDTAGAAIDNIGLFSLLGANGVINELGVENASITASNSASVGIMVGNNHGEISDSYTSGSVASSESHLGGFVGYSSGIITNSYSTANVNASGSSMMKTGGFAGTVGGGSVSSCYATGTVDGYSRVGGFVGGVDGGSVTDSYSTGNVTGQGLGAGGFVGYKNIGTVTNSYALGNVFSSSAHGGFSGIGSVDASNFYKNNMSTTAGLAVNANVSPLPTATWDSDVWDLSGAMPVLKELDSNSIIFARDKYISNMKVSNAANPNEIFAEGKDFTVYSNNNGTSWVMEVLSDAMKNKTLNIGYEGAAKSSANQSVSGFNLYMGENKNLNIKDMVLDLAGRLNFNITEKGAQGLLNSVNSTIDYMKVKNLQLNGSLNVAQTALNNKNDKNSAMNTGVSAINSVSEAKQKALLAKEQLRLQTAQNMLKQFYALQLDNVKVLMNTNSYSSSIKSNSSLYDGMKDIVNYGSNTKATEYYYQNVYNQDGNLSSDDTNLYDGLKGIINYNSDAASAD